MSLQSELPKQPKSC